MFDAFGCNPSQASNNPWECSPPSDSDRAAGPASSESSLSSDGGQFEDSFVSEKKQLEFEKLDDSADYLEKLERKLKKLQTPSKRDSLLKALADRRSDENRRLTNANAQPLEEEFPTDESQILDNLVLRRLFPEKRALHLGELQSLIEADILELIHQRERELSHPDPTNVEITIVEKEAN